MNSNDQFEGFEILSPNQENYIENMLAEFERDNPQEWDRRTFIPEISSYSLREDNNIQGEPNNYNIFIGCFGKLFSYFFK